MRMQNSQSYIMDPCQRKQTVGKSDTHNKKKEEKNIFTFGICSVVNDCCTCQVESGWQQTDSKQPRRTTDVCYCGMPCLPAAAARVRAGLIIKTTVLTQTVTALKAVNDLFLLLQAQHMEARGPSTEFSFQLLHPIACLHLQCIRKKQKTKQNSIKFLFLRLI